MARRPRNPAFANAGTARSAGSLTVKAAPLATAASVSVPPLRSASSRAIARPWPCRGGPDRRDGARNNPARTVAGRAAGPAQALQRFEMQRHGGEQVAQIVGRLRGWQVSRRGSARDDGELRHGLIPDAAFDGRIRTRRRRRQPMPIAYCIDSRSALDDRCKCN